jgi:hypothetical protein
VHPATEFLLDALQFLPPSVAVGGRVKGFV